MVAYEDVDHNKLVGLDKTLGGYDNEQQLGGGHVDRQLGLHIETDK